MTGDRPVLLPPARWAVLDEHTWRIKRDILLGRDGTEAELAQAVTVAGSRPDSFTVAERLATRPRWLAESERDGTAWLRALVTRRVGSVPQLHGDDGGRQAAARHVHEQVRRLLDLPDLGGAPSAETLWNQEIPYVIDRVIGQCLFGDAAIDPDPMPATIGYSHAVAAGLLGWVAEHPAGDEVAALLRVALAAGLIDLGVKGGTALCRPLDPRGYPDTAWLGSELVDTASAVPLVVDHLGSLIATVGHNPAGLVWFTDDLIETAFDLLVVQHLVWHNPRLRVVIAPRSRRTDNDATHHDVARLLRHPALAQLREAVATGRVQLTAHGPGMAAPRLDKLHPALLRELDWADAVVVKGGRNHELLAGTVDRPLWTGYVITREFTEAQAGYDGRAAPLVFVHTPAGQPSWWGWRGRAHRTLRVAADRVIPACWVTIADQERRSTCTDPNMLAAELAWLLDTWPALCQDYARPARIDLRRLADRLTHTGTGLPTHRDLIRRAHHLTNQHHARKDQP